MVCRQIPWWWNFRLGNCMNWENHFPSRRLKSDQVRYMMSTHKLQRRARPEGTERLIMDSGKSSSYYNFHFHLKKTILCVGSVFGNLFPSTTFFSSCPTLSATPSSLSDGYVEPKCDPKLLFVTNLSVFMSLCTQILCNRSWYYITFTSYQCCNWFFCVSRGNSNINAIYYRQNNLYVLNKSFFFYVLKS